MPRQVTVGRKIGLAAIWGGFGLAGLAAAIVATRFVLPQSRLLVESTYDDLKEARASTWWTGGWAPGLVPESATDIHVLVNLDTNETWGSFRFGRSDEPVVRHRLVSVAPACRVRLPRTPFQQWPLAADGEGIAAHIAKHGVELFLYEDPSTSRSERYFAVALLPQEMVVAYWTIWRNKGFIVGECDQAIDSTKKQSEAP